MKYLSGVIEGFYGPPWSHSARVFLFKWMKELQMNTYMYAPKDSSKHRNNWRDLYLEYELDAIGKVVNAANDSKIDFVYAISPGLDVVFTSEADVCSLKNKLKQVYDLGCRSFAMLFDDIEPELCLADKSEFTSSAEAQAFFTNKIFDWFSELNVVLFCPTEYCATRTKLDDSEYLKTIGSNLHKDVQIFWTGPKVVSQDITPQSLEHLTKMLQRKPVIWDNIHANDYDDRRVFLGPFKGRPLELYKSTNGVMTNPNCEFEANFIAFDSLSRWYQCCKTGEAFDAELALRQSCQKWLADRLLDEMDFVAKKKSYSDFEMVSEEEQTGGETKVEKQDPAEKSKEKKMLTSMDLEVICQFFYLPYEHGDIARNLIEDFSWLKANYIDFEKQPHPKTIEDWREKSIAFQKRCDELCEVFDRFIAIPNRRVVAELQSYIDDARDTTKRLKSYVKYLGSTEREKSGSLIPHDPEPWFFRGGATGEMERLIPSLTTSSQSNFPETKLQVIRPYLHGDLEDVKLFCKRSFERKPDENEEHFERTLGVFLSFGDKKSSTCASFVLEVGDEICGMVIGCREGKEFYRHVRDYWLPEMKKKNESGDLVNKTMRTPDDDLLQQYPAVFSLQIQSNFMGSKIGEKMISCLMASLQSNAHHIFQWDIKRKRKEEFESMGFTLKELQHNKSPTTFLYDWKQT